MERIPACAVYWLAAEATRRLLESNLSGAVGAPRAALMGAASASSSSGEPAVKYEACSGLPSSASQFYST